MRVATRSVPVQSANELRCVRRALNTPVLSIAELPVGPATAAIAIHADAARGREHHTLAVRSERSREVVFYAIGDMEPSAAGGSLAADAVLSLAEGMGFLFEESALPIAGSAASQIWAEFVDCADAGAPEPFAPEAAPRLTKFRHGRAWREAGAARIARPGDR